MGAIKINNRIWTFYKWALFLVVLDSLLAWFFWALPIPFLIPILFIAFSIFVLVVSPQLFFFNRKTVLLIFLFYLLARFLGTRGNMNAYLGILLTSMSIFFFLGIKDELKVDFLDFFTKAFAILIAISLLAWLLFMTGVELPSFQNTYGFSERRNEAQYSFQNYYLFLVNMKFRSNTILPRFHSVFLEPGYLSIVLVVVLYINQFNFRNKYVSVLLIALFFTFSLAGWLIFSFAYLSFLLKDSKFRIRTIILVGIGVFAFYTFFSLYNDGDNLVNNYIISRLEYDKEKATISGYNRTSMDFDYWFQNAFLKSDNVFFGLDMYKVFGETINVGWKVYVVNYGIVGLSFYLWFLLFGYLKFKNYDNFIFLILYILIFMRGHHVIYFQAFPILYLGGLIVMKRRNDKISKYEHSHKLNPIQ